MATTKLPSDRNDLLPLPPPINDARRAALFTLPGVIVHRRAPEWTRWTFEPTIRVREDYDLHGAMEQEQDEEDRELLDVLFPDR
jgi:hypothetical protein